MSRGTAYLSGPMAGKPHLNIAAFRLAEAWLRRQNFEVLMPHLVPPWVHEGDCPGGYRSSPDAPHAAACYLRTDLFIMLQEADLVFMLPGWELSVGARLEMQVAATCGLPVKFVPQGALDFMSADGQELIDYSRSSALDPNDLIGQQMVINIQQEFDPSKVIAAFPDPKVWEK